MTEFDFEDGLIPTGWTVPGTADSGWSITTSSPYEGTYCLKANTITHNQTAEIECIQECVPGTLSFAYKVSSEGNYDFLRFYVNNVKIAQWSGSVDWTIYQYTVTTSDTYTFRWSYEKDQSVSTGSDTAWIDVVNIPIFEQVTVDIPESIRYPLTTYNPKTDPTYVTIDTVDLPLTTLNPTTFSAYLRGFQLIFPRCQIFKLHTASWETSYNYRIHEATWASVSQTSHTSSYQSEFTFAKHDTAWTLAAFNSHSTNWSSLGGIEQVYNTHNSSWYSLGGAEQVYNSHTVIWESGGAYEQVYNSHNVSWASLGGATQVFTIHDSSWISLGGAAQVITQHDASWLSSEPLMLSSSTHTATWASIGGTEQVYQLHNASWFSSDPASQVFAQHAVSWESVLSPYAMHSATWKSVVGAYRIHRARWQTPATNYRTHEVRYRSSVTTPAIVDGLIYVRV